MVGPPEMLACVNSDTTSPSSHVFWVLSLTTLLTQRILWKNSLSSLVIFIRMKDDLCHLVQVYRRHTKQNKYLSTL